MTQTTICSPNFKRKENCLYYCGKGKDGYFEQKLCNFSPEILSEVIVNDGILEQSYVRVGGIHQSGKHLPVVELPTDEALSLNWIVGRWGVDCIMELAPNARERIRYALQLTGKNAEKKMEYAVTGWREVDGELEFLMPGDERITVRLPDKMRGYTMARDCTEGDIQALAQLILKSPVNPEVFWPLLAMAFLSPLNHFLEMAGHEPKFVILLIGKTGSRKSTTAALVLCLFGKFTATSLPMSFRDTANYTLNNAFALKDVLTCIDDFHPTGRQEEAKLTNTAQLVMRAYGDRTGRGRLRQDCSVMASRPPQGNAIITAEMAPNIGESGTARYFSLEMKERDMDLDALSEAQKEAEQGAFQRSMYGYIRWLADLLFSGKLSAKELAELGDYGADTLSALGICYPAAAVGGMAEPAESDGKILPDPVHADSGTDHQGRDAGEAGRGEGNGESSPPESSDGEQQHSEETGELHLTGWESQRGIFFRDLQTDQRQQKRDPRTGFQYPPEHSKASAVDSTGIHSSVGAGLHGLAALGNLIENDSDDPEEQRKRIQAQQAGSDLGAILGLAIGAVAAAHEYSQEAPTEEPTHPTMESM